MHHVLEYKLVALNGLAISIGTEFIENYELPYVKQDCELKAFYRSAPEIKKDFPQLKMCLLFDSEEAVEPVQRFPNPEGDHHEGTKARRTRRNNKIPLRDFRVFVSLW
jgi:hypothetical protein